MEITECFRHIPLFQNARRKRMKRSSEMLKLKSDSLFNKRDAIKLYVVRELKKGKKPTSECHKWLKKVVEIQRQVCDLVLESKQNDSQSKILDEFEDRQVIVLKKIAEYLEKPPHNNGIIDEAMDERRERMKGSMVGCNGYQTSEAEKTRKMPGNFDQLSSASPESCPVNKETDLKISMHQNAHEEIMCGPSTAASERAQHYEKQNGYRGPEGKISFLKEEAVSALGLEAGKTPNKPDALAIRETKSASSGKSPLLSTVAHSERSENGARQAMTESSSILEEKSGIVSLEIKEIPPTNEMNNFEIEKSIPETESSVSEAEGTSLKSGRISSKSGNKTANQIMAKLAANFSRRREPKRQFVISTPASRNESFQVVPKLSSSRKHDTNLPKGEEEKKIISRSASRNDAFQGVPKLSSSRKHDTNLPEGEEEKTITCMVKKIMECLQDDKIRKIGIYGRGGIGKTTVLKALLSCPEIKDKFHYLIQVTVSRNWSRKKIRIEIARQIGLSVEGLQSEVEVARKLSDALQSRKFLLLLDDVLENIDLAEVGIPNPSQQSHSRIILATRSEHICKTMDADRQIEVAHMSWNEAWNLFQEQVGGIVDSPDIRPRAETIVSECDGLPLMIIVIGRALAKQNDVLVWRLVLRKLLSVTELNSSDTEDHDEALLQKLKVGYDILRDNDLKYCFLYCALFPENYNIEIPELIKYWIQEGLLTGNPTDAVKKGYRIVRHLTEASLVECWDGFFIKMHDLIRDLASWIMISEENSLEFLVGRKLNKVGNPEQISERRIISNGDRPPKVSRSYAENLLILSRAGAGLARPPEEKEWEEAEMIFLMDNRISALPENLNCSNLKRLFLQRNMRLTTIPKPFFDSMQCLQVLNLSKTNIRSLPPSLFKLTRLQALILCHCQCLSEISIDIGNLASIEILDLNGIDIYSLPDTIRKLSLLKHLHVSFYEYLDGDKFHKQPGNLIPDGLISMLQALEELSITVGPGDTQWNTEAKSIAKELCSLSNLKTVYICFPDVKFLETFIRSSPAWKADSLTKFTFVIGHEVKTSTSCVPKHTELDYHQEDRCLRYVDTDDDHVPNEVKEVLRRATAFYLDHQSKIRSLTEFGIDNIRKLKFCIVSECPQMMSILDGGIVNDESALPKLSHLSLHYLWNLMNIWNGEIPAGSFNALKVLSVHTCPKLKFVLSGSVLPHLPSLEELIVEDCATVTIIIKSEGTIELGAAELPKLKRLELQYLPELVSICYGSYKKIEHKIIQDCPKLPKVEVEHGCPKLPKVEVEHGYPKLPTKLKLSMANQCCPKLKLPTKLKLSMATQSCPQS